MHSVVDAHLDSFQVFSLKNNAPMNICVQTLSFIYALTLLNKYIKVK